MIQIFKYGLFYQSVPILPFPENVLVRVRHLMDERKERCVVKSGPQSLALAGKQFTFDHVAGETASQEELFELAGRPMVDNCIAGYNSTIFAYGQTGSGKTYTMFGAEVDTADVERMRVEADVEVGTRWGMIPRMCHLLFTQLKQEKQRRGESFAFTCTCSYLEIYNDKLSDLLNPNPDPNLGKLE
ncbi:unnamed protein product, partial [Closterium sp. Naga37s-1]